MLATEPIRLTFPQVSLWIDPGANEPLTAAAGDRYCDAGGGGDAQWGAARATPSVILFDQVSDQVTMRKPELGISFEVGP
ncbi:hypothetical protein [Streptomyces sp. NPDC058620]|uniref:hypothetical protein n=1 Tax=Streptomyces sp. NPDC058620 TaxID=3346560 RepID=UPI0036622743